MPRRFRFALNVFLVLLAGSAQAATVTKLADAVLAPLSQQSVNGKVHLDRLPLYDGKPTPVDLEEFQVWAPGGKVAVHDGKGHTTLLDPPPMRFFRGVIAGDPESFVYFSIELQTGKITGLITTRNDNFAVDATPRPFDPHKWNRTIAPGAAPNGYDYYLTSTNASDMNTPGPENPWSCELSKRIAPGPIAPRPSRIGANSLPVQSLTLSGSQHYAMKVEVETDDELYANAGNSVSAVNTYVTQLTGAVSTIYNRDLLTDVQLVTIHVHSGGPGTDQWSAATASAGLYELGTYYHNNPAYSFGGSPAHAAVVMLSGKNTNSGIAWEGLVSNGDIACGPTGSGCGDTSGAANNQYAGAYAWCGSIGVGGLGSVPDPNATNGVLYGMPTGLQNYWPLEEFAHEMGHVMAGHHTQCVVITSAEFTTQGFTDGTTNVAANQYLDHCYNADPGCYAGVSGGLGGVSVFRGTIMSYCHNIFNAGVPQSRFTFGLASEPSHHELDDYMLNAAGPMSGYSYNIATAVSTPGTAITSFTAASPVAPNSTGDTASITATGAATYVWVVTNGTLTGGQGTTSITYTAGASGSVLIKVTAFSSTNVGVTDTRSVTITASTYNPPTGVEAHAIDSTHAQVNWVAPAGGTAPGRYNIYRTQDNANYALVGFTTAPTVTFTDAVSTNKAYVYKVTSADAGNTTESADSNHDMATIVIYTNPTLTAGSSVISTVDINELRVAVDAVRTLAGSGPGNYTFGSGSPSRIVAGTVIHALDINELRTNLNNALIPIVGSTPTYTHTITGGTTVITAIDFTELRNAMR